VAGIPLSAANGPRIRARISIMPESPGLHLRLTVTDNLECFTGLYELDDVRGRIQRALRAVHLADRAGDLCGSLSKGLRQRVALARALLNDPAVLFLDEPTSGLDPVAAREVHELIAALRERGVTIFLTTHRLEEAERLCHRVAILNTTLRLIGRPSELFLAATALFARPGVASAVFQGSHLLVQLLFTPLLAGWSIWVGIAISARSADVRVAQQLGMFASLPPPAIVALITPNVISPSAGLALGLAAALLALDGLGWRAVAAMFDRERLVTGGRT
jgi:ABC-type molybdate transport system ATPase subunit